MSEYLSFDLKALPVAQAHELLLTTVAPRPIAFASTIDKEGRVNLAPFSYFNVFGTNPPTLIFAPNRRGRDGGSKNTADNFIDVPEVVINTVTYDMVEQVSYASTEFDKGVNEFEKAGFTAMASDLVKPPRVAESPAAFECRVVQVIETGTGPGSAQIAICEVLKVHVQRKYIGEDGKIMVPKMHLVGRMGHEYYVKAFGEALFPLAKPGREAGIGFDNMPEDLKNSSVLTGNLLARLAAVPSMPVAIADKNQLKSLIESYCLHQYDLNETLGLHGALKELLLLNEASIAWQLYLSIKNF